MKTSYKVLFVIAIAVIMVDSLIFAMRRPKIKEIENIMKSFENFTEVSEHDENINKRVIYVENEPRIFYYIDESGFFITRKYILVSFDNKKYYKAVKNSIILFDFLNYLSSNERDVYYIKKKFLNCSDSFWKGCNLTNTQKKYRLSIYREIRDDLEGMLNSYGFRIIEKYSR